MSGLDIKQHKYKTLSFLEGEGRVRVDTNKSLTTIPIGHNEDMKTKDHNPIKTTYDSLILGGYPSYYFVFHLGYFSGNY